MISMSLLWHTSRTKSRSRSATGPRKIALRYLVMPKMILHIA